MNNQALTYQNINLVPRYSELKSRSLADTNVEFLGRRFRLPVLPSNMQSVINEDIAHYLSENDYPFIYHRFGDTQAFVERANRENWKLISISVGVKEEDKNLLRQIADSSSRVDWITIDVAHGHHVLVKEMIEFIRDTEFKSVWSDYIYDSMAIRDGKASPGRGLTSIPLPYHPKIIAGNVATPEAVRDLISWGADCCKIGVGGGAVCSTKHQTGFHVPMWTCVKACADKGSFINGSIDPNGEIFYPYPCSVPLIFDGGIRHNGDIAKALVAGSNSRQSNLVMIGSLFAACIDAPGENVYDRVELTNLSIDGNGNRIEGVYHSKPAFGAKVIKKKYHGSASFAQKGENRHVEGFQVELPCNGLTYAEKLQEIKESLQSAISYAGGKDLSAFKGVRWVEVSND